MTNAQKFQETFGIYATEMWAMPEHDFLKWLNADTPQTDCPVAVVFGCDECHRPKCDYKNCRRCKWFVTDKCPPHRMGLIHDSSDFCSYGVRKEISETDKHDKAIEALGYLMKQTKGAGDE